MTTMLKNKYYAHNTYDDGTEIFTIDTLVIEDKKLDLSINTEDKTVYIYTPSTKKDLQVSLPDTFNADQYSTEVKNGIVTIEWKKETE